MKLRLPKTLLIMLGLSLAGSVNAAIIAHRDSSELQYKYDMDSAPNNQDLDGNGTHDWFDTGAPGVSGGSANSSAANQLFRGDYTGSIWREKVTSATTAWALEIKVAKTGGTQGSNGWFGIATDPAGETLSSALYLKDDGVYLEQGDNDLKFEIAGYNPNDYNTIRIAHDAVANSYYYWVNGTLLNIDLNTPFAPGNGDMNSGGAIFIGDYSSTISGDYSIDYIYLDTSGAYAPVSIPEPSSAGLLGVGLAGMLLRRRRKQA